MTYDNATRFCAILDEQEKVREALAQCAMTYALCQHEPTLQRMKALTAEYDQLRAQLMEIPS